MLQALKFLNRLVLFKLQNCILGLDLNNVEICRNFIVGIKYTVA